jgi:aspartyl/asparaginyl beta-hydroxylase (cupin superfamily)
VIAWNSVKVDESPMSVLTRANGKHARRLAVFAIVLAPAAWFAPVPTAIMLACGVLDVSRHHKVTYQLIEEYFTGKGLLTWLLSPINLLADLLSRKPRGAVPFSALPAECQREIETCVAAFIGERALITEAIRPQMETGRRAMLAFRWFGSPMPTPIRVAAFEQPFRYVKTIAVSTFRGREQTSWHFGPQRLTYRVLRNLDPIDSSDVYIAVDDRVHFWNAEPLLIFDDTMFHKSVNGVDALRYCLFVDIIRPNRFHAGFELAVKTMSLVAGSFRAMFYKNWSFVR